MVHASRGVNHPASPHLKSEVAIVAGIGAALWGDTEIPWTEFAGNYDLIRDKIEAVFPAAFRDYNARIRVPGGFRLPVGPADLKFSTSTGKARLMPWRRVEAADRGEADVLILSTLRSHDQYNTTVYGLNDRYRGVFGRRDIVFISPTDLTRLGIATGDRVDVVAAFDPTGERALRGVTAVAKDLPKGCVASYYPEANGLVMLADRDEQSSTPAYKSVPVRIVSAQVS